MEAEGGAAVITNAIAVQHQLLQRQESLDGGGGHNAALLSLHSLGLGRNNISATGTSVSWW
jgi:hypothetical protein